MTTTTKPKIIVATTPNGLIGINGQLPWKKSADLKRFKRVTMGSTLIMGRATWDSIGRRELPGRKTIVVSHTLQPDALTASSVELAIIEARRLGTPIWVVGGASIYTEALPFVDELDVTIVNVPIPLPESASITTLPWFKGQQIQDFRVEHEEPNPDDPTLVHRKYLRK